MRFLVDTNILISAALFPSGKVSRVLSYLLETHDLILCSFSLDEARTVFQRKFPDKMEALERFLADIEFSLFETPKSFDPTAIPVIRDVKDIPILASAILSDVDVLISGDKDFDEITIERPLIFKPGEYLSLIEDDAG